MGHGQVHRFDDPRRPVGRLRQRAHGRLRRAVRAREEDHAARIRTPTRPSPTGAPAGPRPKGSSRREIVAGRDRAAEGPAQGGVADEESPAEGDPEKLRQPAPGLPEGRHHHRGQRLVAQRRRRRPGAGRRARRRERWAPSRSRASWASAGHAQAPAVVHHRARRRHRTLLRQDRLERAARSISGRSTRPSRWWRWPTTGCWGSTRRG